MNENVETVSVNAVPVTSGVGGSTLAPASLGDVIRFAQVMSGASIALPEHLRDNPGACMAVAMQAFEWEMSPFAVASKSYQVKGAIAYESQLITAVVNTRSNLKGRLSYEFAGEDGALTCTVTGTFEDGETRTYTSPPISSITVKNSPLWKSDPQQQLGYYSSRAWARRHCPEVILGVYDRDEAESFQGPDNAKDVTPSTAERLKAAQASTAVQNEQEGFDPAHVASEVETAVTELEISQVPDSDVAVPAASDPVGEETVASVEPPADEGDDQRRMQSSPSTDEKQDVDERFIDACRQMLAVPLMDGLDADKKAKLVELKDFWKGNVREADWPRLETLVKTTHAVLKGDVERSGALDYYAGLLGREASDLEPKEQ